MVVYCVYVYTHICNAYVVFDKVVALRDYNQLFLKAFHQLFLKTWNKLSIKTFTQESFKTPPILYQPRFAALALQNM